MVMSRRVMWCGAAIPVAPPNTMTPDSCRRSVGEDEALPRLVVGACDERDAAEGLTRPAVERHAAGRLGADEHRAGPARVPRPDPERVRLLVGGPAHLVRPVRDDDLGHRVVGQRREQGRDRGHPDRGPRAPPVRRGRSQAADHRLVVLARTDTARECRTNPGARGRERRVVPGRRGRRQPEDAPHRAAGQEQVTHDRRDGSVVREDDARTGSEEAGGVVVGSPCGRRTCRRRAARLGAAGGIWRRGSGSRPHQAPGGASVGRRTHRSSAHSRGRWRPLRLSPSPFIVRGSKALSGFGYPLPWPR